MRGQQRWAVTGGALLLALTLATSCSPDPAATPTPTPTGWASDEEAFAAAEATISAYVDATNGVKVSDPATYEALFALSTGEQNAFDRKRLSEYKAMDYSMSGATGVVSTIPLSWEESTGTAVVGVCLDVSSFDLTDREGRSVVSPDRPDRQNLAFTLSSRYPTFLVESVSGTEGVEPCE